MFFNHLNFKKMSKTKKTKNHNANQQNSNKGTDGTNITYDKVQGNRGKQLNTNQKKDKKQN